MYHQAGKATPLLNMTKPIYNGIAKDAGYKESFPHSKYKNEKG